jgi:hypothetical protein
METKGIKLTMKHDGIMGYDDNGKMDIMGCVCILKNAMIHDNGGFVPGKLR